MIKITAGNEVPSVDVTIEGNKSFYWNDKPVTYKVSVQDKEDGSLANKKIAEDDVIMQIDYLEGLKENVIVGHRIPAGTGMREYDHTIVGSNEDYHEMMANKEEYIY
jgi:hypothetical protein